MSGTAKEKGRGIEDQRSEGDIGKYVSFRQVEGRG